MYRRKEALAKAFKVDEFPRSAKYDTDWVIENMMGPTSCGSPSPFPTSWISNRGRVFLKWVAAKQLAPYSWRKSSTYRYGGPI